MSGYTSDDDASVRPRLAIVDDNAEFRHIVRAVAERLGWAVSEFGTGRSFIASLADALPDRVVLDIVMPDMDGIETVGLMARAALRCPVVLISGREPLYARAAKQLGQAQGLEIDGVLQKPVGLERLRAALDFGVVPSGC